MIEKFKEVSKLAGALNTIPSVAKAKPHLVKLHAALVDLSQEILDSGNNRGTKVYKSIATAANNVISVIDGISDREVEMEHIKELKAEVVSSIKNTASLLIAKKSEYRADEEAEAALAASIGETDKRVLWDIMKDKVRDLSERKQIDEAFKRESRYAQAIDKATRADSFKIFRLPVVPIVETGYYSIEKLAKSMDAHNIDGRYFSLPNQLILAYNPNYVPNSSDKIQELVDLRNKEGRAKVRETRNSRDTLDETMDKLYKEGIAKIDKEVKKQQRDEALTERQASNRKAKLIVKLNDDLSNKRAALDADQKMRNEKLPAVKNHTNQTAKDLRFDIVLRGIESKLKQKIIMMPGAGKYKNTGWTFYWLITEHDFNVMQRAKMGSPVIEKWGFPF